ncbi:MAG: PQQ-binding-like beta-propeller repeat protein [Halobacteriales archaeon]
MFDVDGRLPAPPTVHGAAVYVPDWTGRVHALSIYDGIVRWSRSFGSEEDRRTYARPVAVQYRRLYLGSASGTPGVVALEANTGEPRWNRSLGTVTGGPLVDGDLVVIRTNHLLVGFATDGTRRWTVNLGDARGGPMAVDERAIYVPTGGGLRAIGRSGSGIWTYEPSDGEVGAPTIADDGVVVRTEEGPVALSGADGSEQWTVTAEGAGRPVVVSGGIFTAESDGRFVAFGQR